MSETTVAERLPLPAPSPESRRDRAITLAVNLFGVCLVAVIALALGTALYEGVTARYVALAGIAAVVTALVLAPAAGLLLWMVLSPFGQLFNLSMGQRLPDLSLDRIAALTLLILLLAQVVAGRRRLARFTAVEGWGVLFALAMTLSINGSRLGWVGGVQNVFDNIALPLLCFFFARNILRTPRHVHWLAVTFALVGATLGLIAAREQLTNLPVLSPVLYRWEYGQHSVKVTSLFGAPAIMAMTLAVTLPFSLTGAMRSRDFRARLLWLFAVGATSAGVLLTYVRAGWLAAFIGLVTVLLLSRRAKSAAVLILAVGLLIALAFGVGLIDTQAIQERALSQGPINYRANALAVGLELAARSPILGIGLDNYSDAAVAAGWRPLGATAVPSVAAHNLFIYVLTSGGLLALAPLLALLATIGLRLIRLIRATLDERRDWQVAGLGMFLGYLLIANTIDALSAQYANMLFFLALGALFAMMELPYAAFLRPTTPAAGPMAVEEA